MPREASQKAEYFPHFVGGGKTIRALDRRYGNEGYAFWYKLLETLCDTEGHCLDLSDDIEMIDFSGYVRMDEKTVLEIMELLVRLGQVDVELWASGHKVWIQKLIDDLTPLYAKRACKPVKPGSELQSIAQTGQQASFAEEKPLEEAVNDAQTPQRKEEKRREEKSKPKQSARDGGGREQTARGGFESNVSPVLETRRGTPTGKNPALHYAQRKYDESFFEGLYEDLEDGTGNNQQNAKGT